MHQLGGRTNARLFGDDLVALDLEGRDRCFLNVLALVARRVKKRFLVVASERVF
jgi:hypothetical protein